jgi:hypothetical protein
MGDSNNFFPTPAKPLRKKKKKKKIFFEPSSLVLETP